MHIIKVTAILAFSLMTIAITDSNAAPGRRHHGHTPYKHPRSHHAHPSKHSRPTHHR